MRKSSVPENPLERPGAAVAKGLITSSSGAGQFYWLLCSSCLWSQTLIVGPAGPEWPRGATVQGDRVLHRCGGLVKVFPCDGRRGNGHPVLLSTKVGYRLPPELVS